MYEITDLLSLGNDYTVSNPDGTIIGSVQVVTQSEILEAALGPYTEEFGSIKSYLDKSIAVLSGFDEIDPDSVLWYSTYDDEVIISDVIEFAINNGYDRIILEHMEYIDDLD